MEPETTLTQKIRTVEQKPVHWKKAEVWFAIHEQISTTQKSYRFYYYAAAVIFFMFFNVYKLTIGNELIQDNSQLFPTLNRVENQNEAPETRVIDYNNITYTQPDPIKHEHQIPVAVMVKNETVDFDHEIDETSIQPTLDDPIANTVETVTLNQGVQPIIGVILVPVNNTVSVKPKRKKLLHKLESIENEFDGSPQNTIVIARIK
ncbi:MAG: hypothetical protein KF687_03455 [Cyclobacteriaceae bacterium]|nr:hypothetical protein [Cyclobacteriaceae bacterium]